MKKFLMLICTLSMVLSCTVDNGNTDPEIPPHLKDEQTGGSDDTTPGEDSSGDDEQGGGNEDSTVTQPSGEEMTLNLVSYNVGKFAKSKEELGHDSYPEVKECLDFCSANIVGLNEVSKGQESTLASKLGSDWASKFFYAANTSYGNAIVYDNTSEFVKEYRVNIPKTDGAAEVRSVGVVEFEDFVFCVTHLDHLSDGARMNGAQIITEWAINKYGTGKGTKPVFLVGDMNTTPQNSVIMYLRENWTLVSAIGTTFASKCIDFIFALNNGINYKVVETKVINKSVVPAAEQASDHYGVYVKVTFNRQ